MVGCQVWKGGRLACPDVPDVVTFAKEELFQSWYSASLQADCASAVLHRRNVRNDNNVPGASKLGLFSQEGSRLGNSTSLEDCVLQVMHTKVISA